MKCKILYVGNDSDLFRTTLDETKIEVFAVANSKEAINFLEDHYVAAVVSDYRLPGHNGLFLYDQIQQEFGDEQIPFILLQEEFSADVFERSRAHGVADYYVKKAVTGSQILERVISLNKRQDIVLPEGDEIISKPYRFPLSKRVFDIIFASLVLLIASPFLLLIMIAIRLESKGKVYYIAKRVGRKTFDFYKLRSMKQGSDVLLSKLAAKKNQYTKEPCLELDLSSPCPKCSSLAENQYCSPLIYESDRQICEHWFTEQKKITAGQNATFIKIQDDPRITKIGKFIRNTSIDELPQLINVIKGDMSIVGNRPLPVYEAEMLTEDLRSKRFLAPAGITGLWQVELRGKGGLMSEDERVSLDNCYADRFIENKYSIWYDLKLILRTIPALLQKQTV